MELRQQPEYDARTTNFRYARNGFAVVGGLLTLSAIFKPEPLDLVVGVVHPWGAPILLFAVALIFHYIIRQRDRWRPL